MNQYETVFILTPVLSDVQMKEAVEKFKGILTAEGAEIVNEENWGLKKLAYPIQKKSTLLNMLRREEVLNQLKRRINHGTTSSIRNQIFNSALSRR